MRTKQEYQEALDSIENMLIECDYVEGRKVSASPILEEEVAILRKLVDLATPIKPIEEVEYHYSYDNGDNIDGQPSYSITNYRCPSCSNYVSEPQCCHNNDCRQAIDWEKEE